MLPVVMGPGGTRCYKDTSRTSTKKEYDLAKEVICIVKMEVVLDVVAKTTSPTSFQHKTEDILEALIIEVPAAEKCAEKRGLAIMGYNLQE